MAYSVVDEADTDQTGPFRPVRQPGWMLTQRTRYALLMVTGLLWAISLIRWTPSSDRESRLAILAAATVLGGFWLVICRRTDRDHQSERQRIREHALRVEETLKRTEQAMIFGLARLASERDNECGLHLHRVGELAECLALAAQKHPALAGQITAGFIQQIRTTAVLHDIGKVGIPDAILMKPGQLNESERNCMQQHTRISGDCLQDMVRCLGSSTTLQMAHDVALCHHEWWNGEGYPCGLAGEAIPLAARIVALADVYDALSSRRVYKEAFSHARCVELIRDGSGTQFDPRLVDVFLTVQDQFRRISNSFDELSTALSTGTDDSTSDDTLKLREMLCEVDAELQTQQSPLSPVGS